MGSCLGHPAGLDQRLDRLPPGECSHRDPSAGTLDGSAGRMPIGPLSNGRLVPARHKQAFDSRANSDIANEKALSEDRDDDERSPDKDAYSRTPCSSTWCRTAHR